MFFIVVTIRSLAWTLLSVATVLMHLMALITSNWLIGPLEEPQVGDETIYVTDSNGTAADSEVGAVHYESLGIFTRCRNTYSPSGLNESTCFTYVGRLLDLPSGFWVIMVLLYSFGLLILAVTAVGAVLSICKRTLCHKSIFTLSAFVQAVAGLFILLGLIFYPFGWGSEAVQDLCGNSAAPFLPKGCGVGWSLFLSIGALLLTFLCSLLGVQAEFATASDKVEAKVMRDKRIVCVL